RLRGALRRARAVHDVLRRDGHLRREPDRLVVACLAAHRRLWPQALAVASGHPVVRPAPRAGRTTRFAGCRSDAPGPARPPRSLIHTPKRREPGREPGWTPAGTHREPAPQAGVASACESGPTRP